MPSDSEPIAACREVLQVARDSFRSALARTIEQVRAFLDARPTSEEDEVRDTGASLGSFAAGRVDAARFSALLTHSLTIDASDAARLERAFEVLRDLSARLDTLLELRVPSGGSLPESVHGRLAEIGRAFGAAHLVTAIRAGNYDEAAHADLLEAYPFARWSAAERALAPALFVEVDGADLRACALTEFLDGCLRIVLYATGTCPVAPLARLIAPRTFVLQTHDPRALEALAAWEGAGIAALLPEGTASFRHDPAAAGGVAAGLQIVHLPDGRPRPVGGASTLQQQEDLELLQAWACTGTGMDGESAAAPEDDIAGRLAGWLLQQAQLEDGQ